MGMIQGLIGGMATLGWAVVLFFLVVYVVGLVMREGLGRKPLMHVSQYFDGVPRSMFTAFRCSFGDCNSEGGQPIFEHVTKEYGALWSLIYCCFIFTISIGIFNVISAIFIESTMASKVKHERERKKARMEDFNHWATRVHTLINLLLRPDQQVRSDNFNLVDVGSLEVSAAKVDEVVQDPIAMRALGDLDIDPEDNARLSELLDPDNGGTISIRDLVDGLRRLRGEPKRSDIVACDLMIRSTQLAVYDCLERLTQIYGLLKKPGCVE